jgi:hypothetical protein
MYRIERTAKNPYRAQVSFSSLRGARTTHSERHYYLRCQLPWITMHLTLGSCVSLHAKLQQLIKIGGLVPANARSYQALPVLPYTRLFHRSA